MMAWGKEAWVLLVACLLPPWRPRDGQCAGDDRRTGCGSSHPSLHLRYHEVLNPWISTSLLCCCVSTKIFLAGGLAGCPGVLDKISVFFFGDSRGGSTSMLRARMCVCVYLLQRFSHPPGSNPPIRGAGRHEEEAHHDGA
ncbi:hypothetical protein B0T25DRAFT_126426 [Lasiosphaeria hispida]|uniref:Secreted protein n=1 Tax=Lasiosphaeria hispida TaxID=260671 RepID=A0AAJ0MIF8_9PEZI|nr:hypothetical protein B0T25DRAFT_126426 [Lasiosphaeria hispida]